MPLIEVNMVIMEVKKILLTFYLLITYLFNLAYLKHNI